MKVAPNKNTPRTQICLVIHIVVTESMLDAIFCEGSLPGNDNSCHFRDLVKNLADLRKTEGPRALCYIEMTQIKLGLAKAGAFSMAGCFRYHWFPPTL